MDTGKMIENCKAQLTLVLSFFPRVDSVMSVVLGIDVAMLAVLATNTPPFKFFQWSMTISIVAALLLGLSIWQIYKGAFPKLEGGAHSLIYFREIASRTENNFIEEFKAQTEEDYLKDLLSQIWRNSEILKQKYAHLKSAFILLALAVTPWLISLIIFSARSTDAKTFIGK